MVTISIVYEGNLQCRAIHGPSGVELITGAPADNMGKGDMFSPTDLVAAALGTCILTVMAAKAQVLGVEFAGAMVKVDKDMANGPRRIGRLATTVHIPGQFTVRDRKALEATAFTCPVHKSMSHDVEMPIAFDWE